MPLQSTSGAASYDAFGGGAAAKVNYIEDFFQSYLRTGTGASATVTTGLDGSTKETLVWTKSRSAATNHKLTDNVRGATKALSSNTTGAEATDSQGLTAFSATGYTIGTNTDYNNSGATYVDWQWVAQPKFFDVVTYTGNGATTRTINHSLGSVAGCIMIKATSTTGDWWVTHRNNGTDAVYGSLNLTDAMNPYGDPMTKFCTSTEFYPRLMDSSLNANGVTFVAYLFAHDAGGFGLTGTDNVISCGSFTATGSAQTVTLGYEPQWVLVKSSNNADNWYILDNMRGLPVSEQAQRLFANTSGAEGVSATLAPTATGFSFSITSNFANSGYTYIYIAIRRGQMKVPTDGTKVFASIARTGTGTAVTVTGIGFTPDASIAGPRGGGYTKFMATSRPLNNLLLTTSDTAAGYSDNSVYPANIYAVMDGINQGGTGALINGSGNQDINWFFKRASGFFDVVCYTGTGSANRQISHNLGVAPELVICKARNNGSQEWRVLSTALSQVGKLNGAGAFSTTNLAIYFGNDSTYVAPTSSVFTVGSAGDTNANTVTYVAYLFATCAGVSKVGSYTGNGSSQTINCGFTGGARFVLIRRTDSTGDWMISDSARGIVSGSDPYLELNNTNAEVTGEDWLDTDSTGFVVNEVSGSNANTSSATYIFLAIA